MKNKRRTLSLGRETLRSLSEQQLEYAAGGVTPDNSVCTSGLKSSAFDTKCYDPFYTMTINPAIYTIKVVYYP